MSVFSFCHKRSLAGLRRGCAPAAFLGLLLCVPVPVQSLDGAPPVSRYLRRTWSAEENTSGATITGIAQTLDGYIWVGTSKGLLRFDGQNFNRIDPPGNEPAMHILSLTVDGVGGLWIWLEGAGVVRYQNGIFESMLPLAPADQVTAVDRTADGDILLATLGDEILRYSHGKLRKIARSPNAIVISLAQTSDGRIWAGTSENGLYSFDAKGEVHPVSQLAETKIDCLLSTEDGRMWIGTDNGLAFWDGKTVVAPEAGAPLRHAQIFALLKDRDSNLWIAGSSGLFRLNAQGLSALPVDPGAASTQVSTLMEDREGEIWFSDARHLESLRDSLFNTLPNQPELPSRTGAIFADSQGALWVAPLQGGLFWIMNGRAHRVTQAGLSDDVVYSIDGDQQGIWVGRQRGGVTRIDLSDGKVQAKSWTRGQGLLENSVYAVYESHNGTIWVATLPGGLSRLANGRFEAVLPSDGRSSHSVAAIAEGADGTMWFATANGLLQMRRENLQSFHGKDGLPSEDVICLAPALRDDLWIGTAQGLAFYSAGKIQSVAYHNPLLHAAILGLALDHTGVLWIVTSTHVLAARAESLLNDQQSAPVRLITEDDGLPSQQGVRRFRSIVLDRRGHVWISLTWGISFASVSAFGESAYPVPARIESMIADGQPLNMSSSLRISSADHRIVVHFAGLSYTGPDRVLYEYRLDDFDRQWSEPTALREAAYTNIPPGNYRFRVRASTIGDDWAGPEAVLQFQVFPRFWQTWEFEVSCILALALLVFWGWRLRLQQVISRANLRFEERLAERTRIAQDLHDTLLQGFISASMQLHVVADTIGPQSPARASLSRILELMNQVIEDGRKSLRGLRAGATPHTNLEHEFVAELQNLASPEQITYRVIVQRAPVRLRPVIHDEVLRIGREALLNVLRHAAASVVEVEIRYSLGEFQLIVRDDGRGMDHHMVLHGRDGHWGLPGMRSHAEAIGAKLKILSHPGAGTEVRLQIVGSLAYENVPGRRFRAMADAVPFLRPKSRTGQRKTTL